MLIYDGEDHERKKIKQNFENKSLFCLRERLTISNTVSSTMNREIAQKQRGFFPGEVNCMLHERWRRSWCRNNRRRQRPHSRNHEHANSYLLLKYWRLLLTRRLFMKEETMRQRKSAFQLRRPYMDTHQGLCNF